MTDRSRGGAGSPFAARRRRPVRRAATAALAVVAAAVLATAWLDRSGDDVVDLGEPPVVSVANDAGPVEVLEGTGPARVEVTTSHLATGPRLDVDRGEGPGATVRASCPGWGPCRVSLVVTVPPGTEVEVAAADDAVSVGSLTGPVSVDATAGPVLLGPVSGPLRVRSGSGAVRATDLRSGDVSIESASGPVDVALSTRPARVEIDAGDGAVDLEVPRGAYRLDLAGDPVEEDGLRPSPSSRRHLVVRSAGPVTVTGRAASDR